MNIMTQYGRVFRLLGVALGLTLSAGLAHAQSTPKQVMDSMTLGVAKANTPGCGTDIVDDGGFEGGIGTQHWDHYSTRHGNVINNQFSDPKSPDRANTGNGWLNFQNDPFTGEFAYAQQTVNLPVSEFAFLTFYVRGSAANVALQFSIYIDGIELIQLDGTFTEVYEEYVPIALDLSLYLDGEDHNLRFEVSMAPGDNTFVHIDDVCIETFGAGEGEGEGETCSEACSGAQGADPDGDGLGAACEACAGTDPNKADTDGDGMDDGYEVMYGLSPANPADALLEFDGDGLTNVDEYFKGSDPFNIGSPFNVSFVSHNGTDSPGRGTAGSPWRTVQYAIDNTAASAAKPGVVILLPGTYFENVVLKPYITVRSRTPLTGAIFGSIVGANNSTIDQIAVTGGASGPLLHINNVRMKVIGCRFEPTFDGKGEGVVGIQVDGPEAGGSSIVGSRIVGFDVGIDVYGEVPSLRTTIVTEWFQVGLWIHAEDLSGTKMGSIGDETNPDVGYNEFFNGVSGPAVRYEREEVFLCENIYWGTTDLDEVASLIEGNADFIPFLATSSILPASIFCTVLNGADQSRITNATVTVAPSVFAPITDNLEGVYSLSAVPDGTYTIRASAPPFDDATQTLFVGSGELASVVFVLGNDGDTPPTCGCNAGKAAPNPADALVVLLTPLSMLLAGLYMRRS